MLKSEDMSQGQVDAWTTEEQMAWTRAVVEQGAAQRRRRARGMPDEAAPLRAMFAVWQRFKELGWKDVTYAPYDGEIRNVEVVTMGSTGIFPGWRDEERRWWVTDDGDIYPARPVFYRPIKNQEA